MLPETKCLHPTSSRPTLCMPSEHYSDLSQIFTPIALYISSMVKTLINTMLGFLLIPQTIYKLFGSTTNMDKDTSGAATQF